MIKIYQSFRSKWNWKIYVALGLISAPFISLGCYLYFDEQLHFMLCSIAFIVALPIILAFLFPFEIQYQPSNSLKPRIIEGHGFIVNVSEDHNPKLPSINSIDTALENTIYQSRKGIYLIDIGVLKPIMFDAISCWGWKNCLFLSISLILSPLLLFIFIPFEFACIPSFYGYILLCVVIVTRKLKLN